jgi:hypothetical protein
MKYTPIPKLLIFYVASLLLLLVSACNNDTPQIPQVEFELGPYNGQVPYIKISTAGNAIQDDPKISAQMTVFINKEEVLTSQIGIEFRGSTSFTLFPKKSYGFETWDGAGEDISIEILGLNKEEDWILYGPYSDKTFLRNVLIYELSNDIGQYAVKTKFVELEINNGYQGTYILMEKIKRDKNRVDIKKLEPEDTDAEDITGGYILKIDKTSGDGNPDAEYTSQLSFRSDFGVNKNTLSYAAHGPKQGEETYFLYEYPDEDDITDLQKGYIKNYISDFENALLSDIFTGATRTYTDYIDLDSFVDFFILNELSANPDAYRLSTFLHKQRGEKLKMGPIWDFNIAFGNDSRSASDRWVYQYNLNFPNDLWLVPFWWERLMEDPLFKGAVKTRWTELKSTVFNKTNIESKMDTHISFLNENGTIERNYKRWDVLGTQLSFNSFVGATYEDEVDYVKNWITDRINWMDSQVQGF